MHLGPLLRRLTVHRYRHVAGETTVEFGPDSNLVLGRNGTGKSTLLALAGAAHALDFRSLEGEEFDVSARLEREGRALDVRVTCLRPLSAPTTPNGPGWSVTWSVEADLGDAPGRLRVTQGEQTLSVQVGDEAPNEVSAAPLLTPPYLPLVAPQAGRVRPEAFGALFFFVHDGGAAHFDEALDAYARMKRFHFVHHHRYPDQISVAGGEQFPASLVRGVTEAAAGSGRDLTVRGVPFLDTAVRWMDFAAGELQFRELAVRGPEAEREREFGELRCFFQRADGTGVADDQLSFGQKRLLAFLFHVESCRTAVYADELVNGFHHDWIERSLAVLGDGIPGEFLGEVRLRRQSVLTSQNPLLVDALGFRSAEDMSQRIVVCRTEIRDGREWMVWENLSAGNAGRLWESKEVGLQSVSELLRTQGLG